MQSRLAGLRSHEGTPQSLCIFVLGAQQVHRAADVREVREILDAPVLGALARGLVHLDQTREDLLVARRVVLA